MSSNQIEKFIKSEISLSCMDIKESTTAKGLEQRIHLFETPFKENEVKARIQPPENEARMFEEHEEKYADSIYIPDWREVVLALPGQNPEINPRDLELLATTSYHAQAVRKDMAHDVTPISVDGLILTSDNKFVYGLRGGDVESNKICIVPAQAVSNRHEGKNPIFASFYEGLVKELRIRKDEITDVVLLGYQTDPEFTKAIHFVFYGKTCHKSSKLITMHEKVYNIYQNVKNFGRPEIVARDAIKDAKVSNTEAWEHIPPLLFVDNEKDSIQKIVDSREMVHKVTQYPLLDIGRGPLILYSKMSLN